jgi:hypothetical protein
LQASGQTQRSCHFVSCVHEEHLLGVYDAIAWSV